MADGVKCFTEIE